MMQSIRRFFYGLAVLLAGCTVGPDYHAPEPVTPAQWGINQQQAADTTSSASEVISDKQPVDDWWTTFDDPTLTDLVRRAATGSLNLQDARIRVVRARAQRDVAAGGYYPEASANGSYTHRRVSENGIASAFEGSGGGGGGASNAGAPAIPGNSLSEFDLFQAGFDASWELDVFGGVRRQVQAAEAGYEAAVEDLRATRVTLAAEVARNYLELRGFQRRIALTRKNLKTQQRSLDLTRSRHEAGLGDQVDVKRAQARVARTRAQLPRLQTQAQQTIHRLSILLGKPPRTLSRTLGDPQPLPDLPPQVPVGLPSSLVRRRPDIRQAERQLELATSRVGVAVAELFPKFSLTGSFGFQSTEVDQLAKWESRFFGIGPAVKLPIFQGGRLRATVRVRKAQRVAAVIQYRRTVLGALKEVEDALLAYQKEQTRRRSLAHAVSANREAVRLSRDRYKKGLTDYLTVLDAQRSLLRSEDELARSAQQVRTNLVALYKALGGGWHAMEPSQQTKSVSSSNGQANDL